MQIGTLTIDPPVLLAPMAGVSNRAYRLIARRQGAGLCVTEMVNANALLHQSRKSASMMDLDPEEAPVGVQIAGSDPETMAEAARMAEAAGADLVDINMGCPVRKVVANGDGSALLTRADVAEAVVEAVVKAVRIPVTVKMRAGWDASSITAPQLAERFVALGVQAIAIHARTRADFYQRPANWDYIRQVKARVGDAVPVIGNGDVDGPQAAARMMEETGCDAVMIGRASFGDPWIFRRVVHYWRTGRELEPPSAEERAAMALAHLERLVELKGEFVAVREMRKQLGWYLKGVEGSARFRAFATALETASEARELVAAWLRHARGRAMAWQ
ncbi:MAG: tRNA dihydrouridine synthase DusB [Firmicutes bacterium]|nr:tRNA dihydrouridine synthase DusB [Alicyclobacillaceae bacterium]MCL6497151.1 tRNA dihydrouridine synthase DusB [Bacillota bacterium]